MSDEKKETKFGVVEIVILTLFCTGVALLTIAGVYYFGAGGLGIAGFGFCIVSFMLWQMINAPVTPRGWL